MNREGDMRGNRDFADESRDAVRHAPRAVPLKPSFDQV
jgi:methylmalonyl-CoA mutase